MCRPHLVDLPTVHSLPDGYLLRLFRDDGDLAALAATLSAAFDDPWDIARVRSALTDAPDVKAIYVVAWQGLPIATASSRHVLDRFPESGYVHWVGTHPAHMRKGIATVLLGRLLQDFVGRGYRDAVLETDDFRIAAIKSYLKFGFIPVDDVMGEDHRRRWSFVFQTIHDH